MFIPRENRNLERWICGLVLSWFLLHFAERVVQEGVYFMEPRAGFRPLVDRDFEGLEMRKGQRVV
jgi:hypothetical protein